MDSPDKRKTKSSSNYREVTMSTCSREVETRLFKIACGKEKIDQHPSARSIESPSVPKEGEDALVNGGSICMELLRGEGG